MGKFVHLRKISQISLMREKPITKCDEVMINICRFASANAGLRRKRSAIAVDVREWKELESWRDYATGRLRVESRNGTLSCGGGGGAGVTENI